MNLGRLSARAFYQRSRSNSRILLTAACVLVALYILGFAVSAACRSQSDFVIYRNAGLAALQRKPIYGLHDPSPFQYAPIYAVAFIPLGLLPPRPAQLLWFAVSMALALPMMILGSSRLLFGPASKLSWELVAIPVLLCIRFIHPNFDHGQINLLLLAMVVWGFALANESRPVAAAALLAGSMLAKPFALPVILYLLARKQILCVISLMIFIAAFLLLPGVLLGSGYAVHQTGAYLSSLTSRGAQRSHDLKNKYNQSSAALAVRWIAPREANLSTLKVAATAGFAFQCVLTLGVIAWLVFRRRNSAGQGARLSLAALFCTAAAFSPISWLEYYMALEVPYMALVYIAFHSGEATSWRRRTATLILVSALVINLCTRLFKPALYYGLAYLGSLLVLAAILVLTAVGDPSASAVGGNCGAGDSNAAVP